MRGRRGLTILAALLVLQATLLAVTYAADAAPVRTLAITGAVARPAVPFSAFDGNPAKAFDFNGDGRKEIIAQNDNQYVYVFDSATGRTLFEAKTRFPAGWGARSFNGPEAAVTGPDGVPRLIVANSAAFVTVYRFDAAASNATKFAFVKEWDRRLTDCYAAPGMDSKPVLADLDRDGKLDIIGATEESGIVALRIDGSLLWKKCIGGGNAEPTVGDLNLDGWPDVVFGSDGGTVTAWDGRSGNTLWSFWAPGRFNVTSGSMPVGVGIGQLDGKAGPDVVVGVRDSHDAVNWSQDHAVLIALDSGGRLLWGKQDLNGGNPLTYTRPVVADADGDGTNEVYWGDWNTNGHKPPANESESWKVTGPGNFYRYSNTGALVWKQSLATYWSNKDVPLADIDGDGVQEVLANGPNGGHDGIFPLDSRTGAKEAFIDIYPWMVTRAPVVADLAGNGGMQLIIPAGPQATSQGPAMLVYETGQPFSSVWPSAPGPWVGSVAPPPPPPSGSFNATFTIKNPNAWWQEVTASPQTPRTIADIDVRIDGGPWQEMGKATWGPWTSSYHTPAGTTVEFLATDTGTMVSQSAPFTWLDGTLSKPSVSPGSPPPPPPPSAFNASFEVAPGVNEWWVEVAVQANAPMAGVDVRVNNGAWTALAETDWGAWAKSFHVPTGSAVQFRARSSTGQEDLSATMSWLGGSPPPGGFNPTFTPKAVGNDWWVEVQVTGGTIAKVEANFNNGTWQLLDKQSWGAWAKSIFTPNGTAVRFRATDDAGLTATSAPTTWT